MREKRLLFLPASVAAMLAVAACDEDDTRKYDKASDCTAYYGRKGETCTEVYNPVRMTAKNAPRMRTMAECEAQFGSGNCAIPEDGVIRAVYSNQDRCEQVYGEGNCREQNLALGEIDELGNERTSGWVSKDFDTQRTATAVYGSGGGGSRYVGEPYHYVPVYRPVYYGNTYFFPYTGGYWAGTPNPVGTPERVGGSYFTNAKTATTTPGTTGKFSGIGGPASRAGTISPSSMGASRAGGVGSTGAHGGGS